MKDKKEIKVCSAFLRWVMYNCEVDLNKNVWYKGCCYDWWKEGEVEGLVVLYLEDRVDS